MKIIKNGMLIISILMMACSSSDTSDIFSDNMNNSIITDSPTSSSINSGIGGMGGMGGTNVGNNTSSSGIGGIGGSNCIPKDCDALSIELSESKDAGSLHAACGIVENGCNGYIDCGTCSNIRANCKGMIPREITNNFFWLPNAGIQNLCDGGCLILQNISILNCPANFSTQIICTDKSVTNFVPPEGNWNCFLQEIGASEPGSENIRLTKWCCQ